MLRRILGPRRDDVTGEWRRLHIKELNDLYCSPNIVRVIKSRRMRWAGHVARRILQLPEDSCRIKLMSVRTRSVQLLYFGFLTLEDWTDRWSRNFGKKLPLRAT